MSGATDEQYTARSRGENAAAAVHDSPGPI